MQEPHDGRESTIDDFTSISPSSSTPKLPDPEFYFDSIYVVFQVENVLFRVSNRLLVKESPKFAELFGLIPQGNGAVGDIGSGDSEPIVMPDDIKSADFRCLLKVLYPTSALIKPAKLAKEEWISVLHLSTLWSFLSLRSTVIAQLTAQLRPLEKIMLGRRFFVSSWLFSGYDAFGDIEEMISDEQGAEMGYHTALRLSRIRESRFKLKAEPYLSSSFGLPTPRIPRIGVEDTFKDELAAIRLKDSEYTFAADVSAKTPSICHTLPKDDEKPQEDSPQKDDDWGMFNEGPFIEGPLSSLILGSRIGQKKASLKGRKGTR